MPRRPGRQLVRDFWQLALLGLAYWLAARLSLNLALVHGIQRRWGQVRRHLTISASSPSTHRRLRGSPSTATPWRSKRRLRTCRWRPKTLTRPPALRFRATPPAPPASPSNSATKPSTHVAAEARASAVLGGGRHRPVAAAAWCSLTEGPGFRAASESAASESAASQVAQEPAR